MEELLKAQVEFIKSNDFDRLRLSKKRLVKMKIINKEEINSLCQLQEEVTELEIKLEATIAQKTQQITQIINQGITIENCRDVNLTNTSVSGNVINQNTSQKDISDEEQLVTRTKRQLSIDSQNKTNQGETKQSKLENQSELMEIDQPQSQTWTENFPLKTNIMENKQNQINIGFSSSESIANYSNTTVENNKLSITGQGTSQSTTIGYKTEGGFVEYVGASVRGNEIAINAEKSPLEQATERIKSKLSKNKQLIFDSLLEVQKNSIEKDGSYTEEQLDDFQQTFSKEIEISEIEKLFQLLQIQVQQQSQQILQVQPNFQ